MIAGVFQIDHQAARRYILDQAMKRAKLALADIHDAEVYDTLISAEERQQKLIDGALQVTEMIEQRRLSENTDYFFLAWVCHKGHDLLVESERRAIQAQIKEVRRQNEERRIANLVALELNITSFDAR